jgi:hypothetical protein
MSLLDLADSGSEDSALDGEAIIRARSCFVLAENSAPVGRPPGDDGRFSEDAPEKSAMRCTKEWSMVSIPGAPLHSMVSDFFSQIFT